MMALLGLHAATARQSHWEKCGQIRRYLKSLSQLFELQGLFELQCISQELSECQAREDGPGMIAGVQALAELLSAPQQPLGPWADQLPEMALRETQRRGMRLALALGYRQGPLPPGLAQNPQWLAALDALWPQDAPVK